jgi:hypothetical protein
VNVSASKLASVNGSDSACPSISSTRVDIAAPEPPPAVKRARAIASICGLWSMPTTEQSARASSSAATMPVPVATSSTRWPARGAAALTSALRQRGSCQKLSAADSSS